MMRVDFSVIFDETLQPVSLVVRCGRKGRGARDVYSVRSAMRLPS